MMIFSYIKVKDRYPHSMDPAVQLFSCKCVIIKLK